MARQNIKVDYLARVEGEGALSIKFKGDEVDDVQLKIFEPPRFFEAFLRGRKFTEAPDITARICGICPVAYQMSAVHAMEDALGIKVDGPLRELRRLLYCGEWIESHVLHMFMLHAPDFLGYPDAVAMAKDHGDLVNTALRLKKFGNQLVSCVGGREIHPINVKVGGFYKVPRREELLALREELDWALNAAREAVGVCATLPFPDFEGDYIFTALRPPDEYPFSEGLLACDDGLEISAADYESRFREIHEERSNALHSVRDEDTTYFVGPMARHALNYDKLPASVREAGREAGIERECRNPFKSIIVRGLEVMFALEEARRIIEAYEEPDMPAVEAKPRASTGYAITEAPRGILYHKYTMDDEGIIQDARIVPPTSQNQRIIEADLRGVVKGNAAATDAELTHLCEQAIRNYDPCISCAAHFLKMNVERA